MARSEVCERVRTQVSTRLDSELSQLERAMVDRHLRSCPCCAAYAAELDALTRVLRQTPAATPTNTIVIRRPRRPVRRRLQTSALAGVALVAVGIGLQLSVTDGARNPSVGNGVDLRFPSQLQIDREQRLLQRTADSRGPFDAVR